jgi:hypothetical protein
MVLSLITFSLNFSGVSLREFSSKSVCQLCISQMHKFDENAKKFNQFKQRATTNLVEDGQVRTHCIKRPLSSPLQPNESRPRYLSPKVNVTAQPEPCKLEKLMAIKSLEKTIQDELDGVRHRNSGSVLFGRKYEVC